MSVNRDSSFKFWVVQKNQADPTNKLGSVSVSTELATQLPGSTIEFEFVQVDTSSTNPETLSLASVLIGLSK